MQAHERPDLGQSYPLQGEGWPDLVQRLPIRVHDWPELTGTSPGSRIARAVLHGPAPPGAMVNQRHLLPHQTIGMVAPRTPVRPRAVVLPRTSPPPSGLICQPASALPQPSALPSPSFQFLSRGEVEPQATAGVRAHTSPIKRLSSPARPFHPTPLLLQRQRHALPPPYPRRLPPHQLSPGRVNVGGESGEDATPTLPKRGRTTASALPYQPQSPTQPRQPQSRYSIASARNAHQNHSVEPSRLFEAALGHASRPRQRNVLNHHQMPQPRSSTSCMLPGTTEQALDGRDDIRPVYRV